MSIKDNIINYIKELTNHSITDENLRLFDSGLLTSLDVLSLIDFIEQQYKISLDAEDIDMDSFGTLKGITRLIERLI